MKYLTPLLFLTLMLFCQATTHQEGKWIIDYNSQLLIHGQTNVNKFTCFISCYNNVDTLAYSLSPKSKALMFEKNGMVIPLYNFNCGNTLITKDFRATVKADQYPYLKIAFLSFDKNIQADQATARMEITLANVVKRVTVKFNMNTKGDFLQLTGDHEVCFADFSLEAPQRMMGLVKVQEALHVEFNLLIRPV